MASRTITELASTIGETITILNNHLTKNSLPTPSFDVDGPPTYPPLPDEITAARNAALAASHELHCLLLGPTEHLLNNDGNVSSLRIMYNGSGLLIRGQHINWLSLHYIYHYKLAETFLPGEEVTFQEIASARGLKTLDVRRFLRQAMTNHVFTEPKEGFVAHTASSRVLAQDTFAKAWLGNLLENVWPSLPRVIEASEKWLDSGNPCHTVYCLLDFKFFQQLTAQGFALANNTDLNPFDFLEKTPGRAKQLKDSMNFFQSSPGFEPSHLIDAFDFESIGNGTVVDIGGSHGAVSIEIAKTYPYLHCIVQDLPLAVKDGAAHLPEELKDRIEFMEHDFFQVQPVKNADIYYFRWVFHDWSDEYCIKILRCLIPALKQGARVVVNDVCLPEYGQVPLYMEKRSR